MQKYRKKPIEVEAEQFWPDKPWPKGVIQNHGEVVDVDAGRFYIYTIEGSLLVQPGDYVLTGIAGERYICKPNIFEATYEKVEE